MAQELAFDIKQWDEETNRREQERQRAADERHAWVSERCRRARTEPGYLHAICMEAVVDYMRATLK